MSRTLCLLVTQTQYNPQISCNRKMFHLFMKLISSKCAQSGRYTYIGIYLPKGEWCL